MNNFKKLLASAMALTMVTSVLPATYVSAADYTITIPTVDDVTVVDELFTTNENGEVTNFSADGLKPVSIDLKVTGDDPATVRIEAELTNGNPENIQVIAKDSNDKYWDILKAGWGPATGFTAKDATTTVYVVANKADNYAASVQLVDVNNDNAVVAEEEISFVIKEVVNTSIETAIDEKNTVIELLNLLGDVTEIRSNEVVRDDETFEDVLFASEAMLKNAYKYASVVGYDEDQTAALEHLVGTEINDETKNAVEFANDLVSSEVVNYLKAYDGTVDADVVKEYNRINALLAFKGNVAYSQEDTVEQIEDLFADLEADVLDYKEDNVESDAKKFVKLFVDQPVANGKTVGALVDDEAAISYTYRSSVESFLKKATRDSYTLDDVKYGDVKDEGVVADYIEALENIVTEMEEVKDLLDDTKAEKKAFDKLSSKISGLVGVIEKDYGDDEDAFYDALDAAVAKFRAADVEALKEYVETVVNEFWTVTTEQRTSGTYRVKTIDAGYGRYYGFENVAGEDLKTLMTTLVDEDAEETYYDLLVADAASIDELLDAVTTDIEGLTLSSTITNKDAARIIAAKKALTRIGDALDKESIYSTSLSRTERAAVDANRELINVLYVKLILNGNVVNDGWIDLGNGDWDYYVNGEAFTGWVCSAKDVWYYVSNGHMLRNAWVWRDADSAYYVGDDGIMVYGPTTVDGYAIDANGLWHR